MTDDVSTGGNFYPRSPCGERRLEIFLYYQDNRFLSTLSLRRATFFWFFLGSRVSDFYPRSPCGERHFLAVCLYAAGRNFYPRSPCGERRVKRFHTADISYFYPRSPCGERQENCEPVSRQNHFYPRSPCGERPNADWRWPEYFNISIHALLAESDLGYTPIVDVRRAISIHALLAESDLSLLNRKKWHNISIHALLAESDDTLTDDVSSGGKIISIHALLAESD